jgi:hypothetical protein
LNSKIIKLRLILTSLIIAWKKIFRESKKHEDIEEAMDIPYSLDTPATRIILSPGVYPVEIKFDSRYMEVLIEGLYGNPWSEKEDFEKTILTQPKDKDQPLFITYGDATLKVNINIINLYC